MTALSSRARRVLAGSLLVAATLAGSTPGASAVPGPVPGSAWTVEAPEAHGMDPAVLAGAQTYAFAPGKNTQGVVVVRHGVIVAEWYADGADANSWGASWSVAKSFASALIGIAIDEGKIPSVDVPMTTYYPEWVGTGRDGITLRHILRMESGLDWDEDYDPASLGESEVIGMGASLDELTYAASRPAEVPPGTRWSYSSGDSMLLSGVIEKATGMSAEQYADQVLFGRIGMEELDWWRDGPGHTLTYCCVDTTSRGFARFGLLYLRDGQWNGEQVVSPSWIADSLAPTAVSGGIYGYQWWRTPVAGAPDAFSARGHDCQYIHVIPSLDLVVVRNGFYGKSPCEPVADPNLFLRYPPQGLIPGQGTIGPDRWDDDAFLGPILASITDTPVDRTDGGLGDDVATPDVADATDAAGAPGSVGAGDVADAAMAADPPMPCNDTVEPPVTPTPPGVVAPVVAPRFAG